MPTFNGTSGADIFAAPDNQDWTIIGAGGQDILTGAGGNDTIVAGKGSDTLDGGGGNDTFLVAPGGGADIINGGDQTINGGIGYDIVKATSDNMYIGIESITGVEEISADGHVGIRINGSINDNILDFSNVTLTGIGLIFGGNGNDIITGNAITANQIDGGAGDDSLVGGAANDTFFVGKNSGMDSYDGGLGFDTIIAGADSVKIGLASISGIEAISGGSFADTQIVGTSGDDYMYFATTTLTNIANINAGVGNDTVIGSTGDDTISGGDGDDFLSGGMGNDSLYGGLGHDILSGGAGDDSFYISAGVDLYKGGAGYDTIYATQNGADLQLDMGQLNSIEEISANGFTGVTISTANPAGGSIDLRRMVITDGDIASINGGNGDDKIIGSNVSDFIFGGLGADTLNGFNSDDELHGGGGSDTLIGGNGYDTLYGDIGNDILNGGAQDDILFGGTGDDIFIVSASGGFDEFHGENGIDTLTVDTGIKSVGITAIDGVEAINWDGSHKLTLNGSSGDNVFDFSAVTMTGVAAINGGSGNDIITGSAGDDVINGGIGIDTLLGGIGNDTLAGGVGIDILTGGVGNDLFQDIAASLNGDHITDFALGDRIDITNAKDFTKITLSYLDDGTGTGGNLHLSGVGGLAGAGIDIHFDGSFTTASFQVLSDGLSGAYIELIM